MTLSWLSDRSDPRVKTALTRTCGICKQKPGQACRHPWETAEPLDRIVHRERADQHLDKKRKKDE